MKWKRPFSYFEGEFPLPYRVVFRVELWQKWEPLGSREEYHERVQEMGNPGEREREREKIS